jgi:hypothetical protein
MPTPIFELQQSLTEIGKVRAGDRTEKGAPRRLTAWRITSSVKEVIEKAAELYGGSPKPWRSPIGDEWEVYTDRNDLPVWVMPGHSLRQQYELWEGPSRCTRRCDGVDESISGGPCICNANGVDECDLHTRLTVLLPELATLRGWRLETRGWIAARELRGSMAIAAGLTRDRFVPGILYLTERRGQQNGQATRFVVPVIDYQISWSVAAQNLSGAVAELPAPAEFELTPEQQYEARLEQEHALETNVPPEPPPPPASYTPLDEASRRKAEGASLEVGLDAVEREDKRRPTGRAAEEVGPPAAMPEPLPIEVDDEPPEAPIPSPEPPAETPEAPPPLPQPQEEPPDERLATEQQKKLLNVLVGELRDDRSLIETKHLWGAMREALLSRGADADPEPDDEGNIHWAPLRERLTRKEASGLIDRLEKLKYDMDKAGA